MTQQDFHIDSLQSRIADAEEQLKQARLAWYESLPAFPLQNMCPVCAVDWTEYGNLQRMEHGYERWTNGDIIDQDDLVSVHWSTDGWDDMSEHGDFEYVQCNPYNAGCGACFQIPEEEDWD